MGCDIHLHTEIKVNGEWHHYSNPDMGRWYELFGIMAGVRRQDEEPIVPPRGLPDDMTLITRMDADEWKYDGHSYSWFGPEEIKTLSKWMVAQRDDWPSYDLEHGWVGYLFGNGWSSWEENPQIEDIRFIFWFDN